MATRASVNIERTNQRFQLIELSFTQQYSHMYFQRLEMLKGRTQQIAMTQFGATKGSIYRALDVPVGKEVFCIGTVFRNSASNIGFLKAYTEEQGRILMGGGDEDDGEGDEGGAAADDLLAATNASKVPDTLVIEDESGRIQLKGPDGSDSLLDQLVTGMVIGVQGVLRSGRNFEVIRWFFCGAAPSGVPRKLVSHQPAYIAFVSNLGLSAHPTGAVDLLLDFIAGNLNSEDSTAVAASVARLIIAGLLQPTDDVRLKYKVKLDPSDHIKPSDTRNPGSTAKAMREADRFLSQVGETIPVDVMPGEHDATNTFIPQQPIHPVSLFKASRKSTVKLVTNPFEFHETTTSTEFFVSSGQNVLDVIKQLPVPMTPTDVLTNMLYCSNTFPTAPSTIPCYPFKGQDPFVLSSTPHYFVAGGQAAFSTALVSDGLPHPVRVVAVPDFQEEPAVILLDAFNPEAEPRVVSLK